MLNNFLKELGRGINPQILKITDKAVCEIINEFENIVNNWDKINFREMNEVIFVEKNKPFEAKGYAFDLFQISKNKLRISFVFELEKNPAFSFYDKKTNTIVFSILRGGLWREAPTFEKKWDLQILKEDYEWQWYLFARYFSEFLFFQNNTNYENKYSLKDFSLYNAMVVTYLYRFDKRYGIRSMKDLMKAF